MKIILGVDDSDCSQKAIEWVRRIDWPAGSRIIALTVIRPALHAFSENVAAESAAAAALYERELELSCELGRRTENTLREFGLSAESRVSTGDPRAAIVEEARRQGADLIVVGSHGRTGIGKLVLGSVSSHVVTHAPCTVVVVRNGR